MWLPCYQRNDWLLNSQVMGNYDRNLLMVLKNHSFTEPALEQEMNCLNEILIHCETAEKFCLSHELVNRNHITHKPARILKESRHYYLRAFRFLINKN